MKPNEELEYRSMRADERDLDLYAKCFARNGSPRDERLLRWMHLENPTGAAMVDFASTRGSAPRLAGLYAVLPVWARVGGRRVRACQSLDTLTDEDFRGRGLFVRTARTTYERATQADLAFVYGFPNANSAPGFFTKLQWHSLDPIPFLVRPLRTGLILARLAPRANWLPDIQLPAPAPRLSIHQDFRTIARFGASHDEIWQAFSSGIGVSVDRDSTYLNWRLRDKPGHGYRVVSLEERGRILGFVAFTVAEKHGGRIGYVLELLHLPERPDAGRMLAEYAVHELAQQRADLAFAWCFPHSPNYAAHRQAGFLDFPPRLRPVELHFGARPLAVREDGKLITDRRAWYLSYLDSDTV